MEDASGFEELGGVEDSTLARRRRRRQHRTPSPTVTVFSPHRRHQYLSILPNTSRKSIHTTMIRSNPNCPSGVHEQAAKKDVFCTTITSLVHDVPCRAGQTTGRSRAPMIMSNDPDLPRCDKDVKRWCTLRKAI